MKKFLPAILILLIVGITTPGLAQQRRGALPNQFASWYTVTTSNTITFPFNSRDITIHNGSTVIVCVDLKGDTITSACVDDGSAIPSIVQLDANTAISLSDYITNAITLRSIDESSASPVSVVVTY